MKCMLKNGKTDSDISTLLIVVYAFPVREHMTFHENSV